MKDVEHFTFMLPPDIWRKKPHPSSFKMDMEYAARVYPGSTPILDTREVRRLALDAGGAGECIADQ
jgi:hypothetical protein